MWIQRVVLRPGAQGPAVAAVRRCLRRLGYDVGDAELDARTGNEPGEAAGELLRPADDVGPYDEYLARAVARFQARNGLTPDGVVGPATWRRLLELWLSPASGDVRAAADPQGRASGRRHAGYSGAPGIGTRDEALRPSSPWAAPPSSAVTDGTMSVHVSLHERRLTLLMRPAEPDDQLQRRLFTCPVAVGRAGSPTPRGRYTVSELIPHPGPPLGSRWIRLHPDACCLHGTDEPWTVGQAATPGCIRLYNKDVEFIYHRVARGTVVVIE